MINLLGAELGDRLISPQAGVNEKGFWEHEELLRIDEAILSALGSCWYDLRPLPDSWWHLPELEPLRVEGRAFVEREFSGRELAALKDPRLCRLLPFWEPLLRDLGWRVKVLMVLRPPSEVSASLCKRDPFTEESADLLWLRYQMEADRSSSGMERCLVSFDDLLADWRAAAQRIGRELEIDWPKAVEDAADAIDSELDPRLRHQRRQSEQGGTTFRRMANQVFELLASSGDASGALETLRQQFEARTAECGDLLEVVHKDNQRLVETTLKLQVVGEELAAARDTVETRDRQIQELSEAHTYAVGVVEERDRQIGELSEAHTHAVGVVQERDAQLARVQEAYHRLATYPLVRVIRKLSRTLE